MDHHFIVAGLDTATHTNLTRCRNLKEQKVALSLLILNSQLDNVTSANGLHCHLA